MCRRKFLRVPYDRATKGWLDHFIARPSQGETANRGLLQKTAQLQLELVDEQQASFCWFQALLDNGHNGRLVPSGQVRLLIVAVASSTESWEPPDGSIVIVGGCLSSGKLWECSYDKDAAVKDNVLCFQLVTLLLHSVSLLLLKEHSPSCLNLRVD